MSQCCFISNSFLLISTPTHQRVATNPRRHESRNIFALFSPLVCRGLAFNKRRGPLDSHMIHLFVKIFSNTIRPLPVQILDLSRLFTSRARATFPPTQCVPGRLH